MLDNNTVADRLADALELLSAQKEDTNINDQYTVGLYNGMELIIATIEGREPHYYGELVNNVEPDIAEVETTSVDTKYINNAQGGIINE
jgi:hypothetical protein